MLRIRLGMRGVERSETASSMTIAKPSRCARPPLIRSAPPTTFSRKGRRGSPTLRRLHSQHRAMRAVIERPGFLDLRQRNGPGGDVEAARGRGVEQFADGAREAFEGNAADAATHQFDRR